MFGTGNPSEPPHIVLHAAITSGRAQKVESQVEALRAVKSKRELGVMKRAADISSDAHSKVGLINDPSTDRRRI